MSPSLFSILLMAARLGLRINIYLNRRRETMSPEQRAEYDSAMAKARQESFGNAGGMGSGVGE